jgi:hypothetical protein
MYRGSIDNTGQLVTAIFPEDEKQGEGGGQLKELKDAS